MIALPQLLRRTRVLEGIGVSPVGWIEALHNGLPIQAVDAAIQHGILTRKEAYALVITRRALSSRRRQGRRLTLEESDNLSRIARLTIRAAETFGSPNEGVRWLRVPNGALAGRSPIDLLRSGEGAVLVEQILGRIDHGVYT